MIRTGQAARIWVGGGLLLAAVLSALTWMFLINPQYAEAESVRSDTESTQLRQVQLRKRLAELETQNTQLEAYKAELLRSRQALPTSEALSDLLRELHNGGDNAKVSVTGVTFGVAVQAPGSGDASLTAVPVNLTALGTVAQLNAFLDQLQQVQPRAVLITSARIEPDSGEKAAQDAAGMSLSMYAFVAAP